MSSPLPASINVMNVVGIAILLLLAYYVYRLYTQGKLGGMSSKSEVKFEEVPETAAEEPKNEVENSENS